MNTLNTDRLTSVLSAILSDKYGKRIKVTLEGKDDNSDSGKPCAHSCGDSRLHHGNDAV